MLQLGCMAPPQPAALNLVSHDVLQLQVNSADYQHGWQASMQLCDLHRHYLVSD